MTVESTSMADDRRRTFQLQEIQTAPLGLMDGSVSTLAPIFATAGLTGRPLTFFVELAVSLGTAVNKGGAVRRRKRYRTRQSAATWYNNGLRPRPMRHAPYLPFLIPNLGVALKLAYAVVVCELLTIVFIRYHFICGKLASTIVQGHRRRRDRLRDRRRARTYRRRLSLEDKRTTAKEYCHAVNT